MSNQSDKLRTKLLNRDQSLTLNSTLSILLEVKTRMKLLIVASCEPWSLQVNYFLSLHPSGPPGLFWWTHAVYTSPLTNIRYIHTLVSPTVFSPGVKMCPTQQDWRKYSKKGTGFEFLFWTIKQNTKEGIKKIKTSQEWKRKSLSCP